MTNYKNAKITNGKRTELLFIKQTFPKNSYPKSFIDKCFKRSMDNIHAFKETALTVEKKSLVLVHSYLGSVLVHTRNKLKKSLKTSSVILKCKYCLKIRPDAVTTFISKIGFEKILLLVSFFSFVVDSARSPIMVNVLDI